MNARSYTEPCAAKYFGFSQNDFEGYCTCARCKAVNDEEGSTAGTNIRFVNAVAEAVEREYPDKVIETLAYLYNARFVADMRAWREKCDQMYVWDYVTSFENYLAVFANESVLQPNVRFFRDHGAVGLFAQGNTQGRLADMAEFKCWLLAKLMWNSEASYDALVRQFTDGHYGKAAPYLREYLERRKSLAAYGTWRPWEDVETARISNEFLDKEERRLDRDIEYQQTRGRIDQKRTTLRRLRKATR